MSLPELTLGVEEEYQIVNPETRELSPNVELFLDEGAKKLQEQIKPELMRSQVEVGTRVCRNIQEVRQEIIRLRRAVHEVAEQNQLRMVAASTHPFSKWSEQQVTEGERYIQLQDDMGEVARRLLIFGMHIHVGISDRDIMVDVMNQSLYFLPHLLALSTSSPMWHGRNTNLKSYRSVVFENLPRSGIPPMFNSYSEYERLIDVLVATECIDEPTKIWWDVRPHPKFPTLEFRICDICTRIEETLCITALVQAICAKLIRLRRNNQSWRRYPRHLINENKWRAMRYGVQGQLIDFGKRQQVPLRFLTLELLDFVDEVVDELGTRREIEYAHKILAEGTSADRQLEVFRETGSLEAIVDHLMAETIDGVV